MGDYSFLSNISSSIRSNLSDINEAVQNNLANYTNSSILNSFKNLILQATTIETPKLTLNQPVATPILEFKSVVPNFKQYANECGPTSLAMVLSYNGIEPGNYHNYFTADLAGHSPLALKEIAESKGAVVRQGNDGTVEKLEDLRAKSFPAIVLGSWESKGINNLAYSHYMVYSGCKKDSQGQITHVYLNDPATGATRCMTKAEFLKFWDSNPIPGSNRYYMVLAAKGAPKEKTLNEIMPKDKMSESFGQRLKTIHKLEEAMYTVNNAVNKLSQTKGGAGIQEAVVALGRKIASYFGV